MKKFIKRKIRLNGYPIPFSRQSAVRWVNGTPHLSVEEARSHDDILKMGSVSYPHFCSLLRDFLSEVLTSDMHLQFLEEAYSIVKMGGSKALYNSMLQFFVANFGNDSFTAERLMTDRDDKIRHPLYAEKYDEIAGTLHTWLSSIDASHPLNKYEKKLFMKYASDAGSRTGEGYLKQVVGNYIPSRDEFKNMKLPKMDTYEQAVSMFRKFMGVEGSFDGHFNMEKLKGFLSRARSTTSGGAPFQHNMAEFLDVDDLSNPYTWADMYNKYAIFYLFLDAPDKIRIGAWLNYVAQERVQAGGLESWSDANTPSEQIGKANKQRFVQAQSAIMSHAHKFIIDGIINHLRAIRPQFVADKFGEETVSVYMKQNVHNAVGSSKIGPDVKVNINIGGTDFTNFDATQDVCISNDSGYMLWRRIAPAWMCSRIIDTYIINTYREARIFVPGLGAIQTTGVKSGMVDTNLCDTLDCMLDDIYELLRYREEHPAAYSEWCNKLGYTDETLFMICYASCMANGDDRFKLTPLDADLLERYDEELGFVAQKSKQEFLYANDTLRNLGVTFLKTIICLNPYNENQLIRTDSICKLIMSRLNPERAESDYKEASELVACLMSASRSVESPYLYIFVDFLYNYIPLFRRYITGEINMQYIIDQMVAEQMTALALKRGKKWMKRKGMDYDLIIAELNARKGYGEEGYRGVVGGLSADEEGAGLTALPQVSEIIKIAAIRLRDGVIGSFFSDAPVDYNTEISGTIGGLVNEN